MKRTLGMPKPRASRGGGGGGVTAGGVGGAGGLLGQEVGGGGAVGEGGVGGGDHRGVAGEAEVIVGAEVEDVAAVDRDVGGLRRGDHALVLVEAGVVDLLEDRGVVVAGLAVHVRLRSQAGGRAAWGA